MDKLKVLIIKTGYSEILDDRNNSRKVSLGDVLRTTPILHVYKDSYVTWITDIGAFPLLEGNPHIKRLLPYDLTTVLQIEAEEFDIVINLEKIPGICAWADKIKAWKKFGFRFDSKTGKAEAYDKAFEVLAVSSDSSLKKENQRLAQELLFDMVGQKWNGEEYVLGYNPETKEMFDVGLNTQIGQKWPSKAWNQENWDRLEKILKSQGLKVTRQDKESPDILKNLYRYADWINSCKIIVTNDSLGMHIGIALKKQVFTLFGPTSHKEVHFYGKGKAFFPKEKLDCMPCNKGLCEKEFYPSCIALVTPEDIAKEIFNILNQV